MKIEEIIDIYEEISETADNGFSLFHALDLIWYPLKTSENQRLSDFVGVIKRDQWHEMG